MLPYVIVNSVTTDSFMFPGGRGHEMLAATAGHLNASVVFFCRAVPLSVSHPRLSIIHKQRRAAGAAVNGLVGVACGFGWRRCR